MTLKSNRLLLSKTIALHKLDKTTLEWLCYYMKLQFFLLENLYFIRTVETREIQIKVTFYDLKITLDIIRDLL